MTKARTMRSVTRSRYVPPPPDERESLADLIEYAIAARIAGDSLSQIVKATGIPATTLGRYFRRRDKRDSDSREGNPSPTEIAEGCREIQREWSPRERAKRAGSLLPSLSAWMPPTGKVHPGRERQEDAA
jgi:hypothetical protein